LETSTPARNGDQAKASFRIYPFWAKKISVSNVEIRDAKSTAHVLLDGAEGMRRKLRLVNEAGTWKTDKVQGRDGGD
jgi:hypothetical protein